MTKCPFARAVAVLALMSAPMSPLAPAVGRAEAQTPAPTAPPAAAAGTNEDTLERALETARGSDAAATAPVLLVVDPQHTRPVSDATPLLGGSPRLRDVAARFGRKVVRISAGLSVLAPDTMTVLNARPGKPDLFTNLSRNARLQLLQATLSPEQWRKLGGERGLGLGDLPAPEQRALFLAVLPNPLRVQRGTRRADGVVLSAPRDVVELAPGQRAQARLRLRRTASFGLRRADNPNEAALLTPFQLLPEGAEMFFTPRVHPTPTDFATRFGVALRQTVPNRLKPGDLNWDDPRFARTVSLSDAGTVGDLIERAGRATGLELYADRRVGDLPVWTRRSGEQTDSARAGDLLRALCLAVTSTFRHVADEQDGAAAAYVLTDDREGLGARVLRLSEWHEVASAAAGAYFAELETRINRQNPFSYLGFDADDPLALSREQTERIERAWAGARRRGYKPFALSVADLPAAQQEAVRRGAANLAAQNQVVYQTDRVEVDMQLRFEYLVPGVSAPVEDTGYVSGTIAFSLPGANADVAAAAPASPAPPPAPAGPARFPAGLASRALLLAPATSDEVRQAAREAGKYGLNQLWVEVGPDDPNAPRRLAEAIQAGRENGGVPVWAVVRLLRAAVTIPAANADRNIAAETNAEYAARRQALAVQHHLEDETLPPPDGRDWRRIDQKAAMDDLRRRVVQIASVPGLAGLALRDTAAPGYEDPATSLRITFQDPTALGYTPAQRLTFLRWDGYDPVDLVSTGFDLGPEILDLPFYHDHQMNAAMIVVNGRMEMDPNAPKPPLLGWRAFRNAANVALLGAFFADLRAARPDLPLFVRDRSTAFFGEAGGWWGSWDAAERLPGRVSGGTASSELLRFARTQSRRNLRNVSFSQTPSNALEHAHTLALILGNTKAADWNGVVLDLSNLPVAQALERIATLEPEPAQP